MQRPHFLQERCTYTITRYPWITTLLCATSIAIHYIDTQHIRLSYSRDSCALLQLGSDAQTVMAADGALIEEEGDDESKCLNSEYWYTPISYSLAHVSDYHLWQNMIVLALSGILLELTESSGRALLVFFISAPLAAGGHGLVFPNKLRGISGVVYAFILYQFGLLIKNFREMRFRPELPLLTAYRAALSAAPTRLIIAALLLLSEVIISISSKNVSHAGHVTGSIVGLLCGVAFGSNVLLDPYEIILPFLGLIGLFAVTFGILVSEQIFVVLWSWFAILSSVPYVYKEIMRWTDRWRIFFFPDTWTFAISQRE